MTLQERLDRTREKFAAQAPAEVTEAFKRAKQELIESGQAEKALKEGERAPRFQLANTRGETVDSRKLLAEGPLVVSFYRGEW